MTRQIALRLSDALVEAVDRLVVSDPGLASRSEAIRVAVERYVASASRAAIDGAIVEAYDRTPPGQVDEWGDAEQQALQAALLNAARLDAEDVVRQRRDPSAVGVHRAGRCAATG
jgi:Arc/MetJ-type ribon-helix-helix transcriptional regulator